MVNRPAVNEVGVNQPATLSRCLGFFRKANQSMVAPTATAIQAKATHMLSWSLIPWEANRYAAAKQKIAASARSAVLTCRMVESCHGRQEVASVLLPPRLLGVNDGLESDVRCTQRCPGGDSQIHLRHLVIADGRHFR